MRLAILILVLFLGGSFLATKGDDATFTKVNVDGHVGYIIPAEYWTNDESKGLIKSEVGGYTPTKAQAEITYWTPTAEQVAEAEKAIHGFIRRGLAKPELAFPDIAADPKRFAPDGLKVAQLEISLVERDYNKYTRQFVGVEYGGEKRIFCHYFYDMRDYGLPAVDPATTYLSINDGGHTVWQIEYHVKSEKCDRLQINGPWDPRFDGKADQAPDPAPKPH